MIGAHSEPPTADHITRLIVKLPSVRPLDDDVDPRIAAIAFDARDRGLVIFAGAGLSHAEPTGLPLGAELATRVHDAISAKVGSNVLSGVDRDDLVSVADAVEGLEGGPVLLQGVLRAAARFTTAIPNAGHQIIAVLTVEGATACVVVNYDDCIERGLRVGERLQAIVTEEDRAIVVGAAVLKAHGCATRAGSLIASTAQLASPPTWVIHELGGRLADSLLVFVGLGDVPNYIRIRIEQLLAVVGSTDNVWVVAPALPEAWRELVPDIDERFVSMTASEFLDGLCRAYLRSGLEKLRDSAASQDNDAVYEELSVTEGAEAISSALGKRTALSVLSWLRASAASWRSGDPVVGSPAAETALLAAALLAAYGGGTSFEGSILRIGDRPTALVLLRSTPSAVAVREAARQAQVLRDRGDVGIAEPLAIVCAGHDGPLPARLPVDLMPGDPLGSVVAEPDLPPVMLYSAHAIVEGAIPEEWAA